MELLKKTCFTLNINLSAPGNLPQISSAILCIAWAKQVTCTIFEYNAFITVPAFIMYGVVSLRSKSTLLCYIPSGHKRNVEISKSFVIFEKLAFSRTSDANKNILPGSSTNSVPTITFAMNLPSTSIVSSIETQIFFPVIFFP
jgi:hypothetical protein